MGSYTMRIIKSFTLIVFIGIAALTVGSARAAVLDVVDGELRGAAGVVVGDFGTFDVQFVDGSCFSLFEPCNPLLSTPFTLSAPFIGNGDVAFAAGNALLSQVFTGDFDTTPGLTRGCVFDTSLCTVLIPTSVKAGTVSFFKVNNGTGAPGFGDGVFSSGDSTGFDTTDEGAFVYAVFTTASVSVIPLPPAALLFGTALLGLAGIARRRRQA